MVIRNLYLFYIQEEEGGVDATNMEEDVDGDIEDIEALNYDDLDNVSKLQKSQRYADIMQVDLYYASSQIYFCFLSHVTYVCLWWSALFMYHILFDFMFFDHEIPTQQLLVFFFLQICINFTVYCDIF